MSNANASSEDTEHFDRLPLDPEVYLQVKAGVSKDESKFLTIQIECSEGWDALESALKECHMLFGHVEFDVESDYDKVHAEASKLRDVESAYRRHAEDLKMKKYKGRVYKDHTPELLAKAKKLKIAAEIKGKKATIKLFDIRQSKFRNEITCDLRRQNFEVGRLILKIHIWISCFVRSVRNLKVIAEEISVYTGLLDEYDVQYTYVNAGELTININGMKRSPNILFKKKSVEG